VPRADLVNVKEVPLDVITLRPLTHPSQLHSPTSRQCDNQHQSSRDTHTPGSDDSLPTTVSGCHKRSLAESMVGVVSSEKKRSGSEPASKRSCFSLSSQGLSRGPGSLNLSTPESKWILDIDLDFFSTGNPYRDLFSKVCIFKCGP